MSAKQRIRKLEAKHKPTGRLYVVYSSLEDCNLVLVNGTQMTKAEFQELTTDNDIVLRVVRTGVDLEKI